MATAPAPNTDASSVLAQIRETIEARLTELEPVAMELERLRRLREVVETLEASGQDTVTPDLTALLGHASAGGDAVGALPRPMVRRGRRGTKRGRDGRAPQGANKQLIIQTILERPGITAPEIAELTGIKRTIVAATINRLKRGGELEPFDEGVRVPFVARERAPA
jgi:hypothetical protein